MRPKKPQTTGEGDLFRAQLDHIVNMRHELVQLASKIDWDWIDDEIAPLYSDKGRPGIETRFVIGLLLLKHIYGLSHEGGEAAVRGQDHGAALVTSIDELEEQIAAAGYDRQISDLIHDQE